MGAHLIRTGAAPALLALALALTGPTQARAAETPYPAMAPLEKYLSATREDEIALARSAAPPSISDNAEVIALGPHGYETAAKGTNGFTCIVERSWSNDFPSSDFWNPKVRAPICFNAASTRTVLPFYLKRTEWVLAGVPVPEMIARTRAGIAAHVFNPPEVGSMCFMLSKGGYLGDDAGGHWRPHLMFFTPPSDAKAWGAGLPGSPVMGGVSGAEPSTVFFVPVAAWSDGTPASPMKM